MIKNILIYIFGKITNHTYYCDRCIDVENHPCFINSVGIIGFLTRRRNNNAYCKQCWNYIRIKKGQCKKCKLMTSVRSNYDTELKTCSNCYTLIKMEHN